MWSQLTAGFNELNVDALANVVSNLVAPLDEEDIDEINKNLEDNEFEEDNDTNLIENDDDADTSKKLVSGHASGSDNKSTINDKDDIDTSLNNVSLDSELSASIQTQSQSQIPLSPSNNKNAGMDSTIFLQGDPMFERNIQNKYRDSLEAELESRNQSINDLQTTLSRMAESLKKVTERNDDLQEQLLMAQQNEDVITGERDSSDLHLKLDEAEARALKAEEDLNDIT